MMLKKYRQERKNKKLRKTLAPKVKALLARFDWIENGNFGIERICDFFNDFEEGMKDITSEEVNVGPVTLKKFVMNSIRQEYGWFRALKGEKANWNNTFIQPTGHFDENFRTHTVNQLMGFDNDPSSQGGFAKRPMTTKEFYFEAFVKPFLRSNYAVLKIASQEL